MVSNSISLIGLASNSSLQSFGGLGLQLWDVFWPGLVVLWKDLSLLACLFVQIALDFGISASS